MSDSNITKRALAQALKDLMRQQPLQKISVGQICGACGMNRKSFYYHFRDKQDLVYWIFRTEFLENVHLSGTSNGWSLLIDVCHYLYGEREFYRDTLSIQGQNSLREYLHDLVSPLLLEMAAHLFQDCSQEDLSFCLHFYADAFLTSIVHWLSQTNPVSPEEYVQQLKRLMCITSRIIQQLFPDALSPASDPLS